MTTYRERREARAERLREWADKRDDKAAALHERNEPYRGDIAFNTQPGHIPERARVIARTERAFEHSEKAASMRSRADSIEAAADAAIYDDDPDALERLAAKLAGLEAKRDRIKRFNATARKGAPDFTILTAAECAALGSHAHHMPEYHARKRGQMPPYVLSNLAGVISNTRKRIEHLTREEHTP